MPRHYLLRAILSLAVVGSLVFGGINAYTSHSFPFFVHVIDAHEAKLVPFPGIAFPADLTPGDRLDWALQPHRTRVAIAEHFSLFPLSEDQTYDFVISRGAGAVTVPVTTVGLHKSHTAQFFMWSILANNMIMGALALIVLWRGRDRAALGIVIWTCSYVIAYAFYNYPVNSVTGLVAVFGAEFMFLLERIGFYIMVDAVVRSILGVRTRTAFLTAFIVMLAIAAGLFVYSGPLFAIYRGWSGIFSAFVGLALSLTLLVPGVLLMVGYQHARPAQRLRLRWMLISSIIFIFGVFLSNTSVFGLPGYAVMSLAILLGAAGFLYSVLRYRLVDLSIVIDRTLVYGTTTTVVIGIISGMEAIVQHAALGEHISLALQIGVLLGIGLALGGLHKRFDAWVERLFFRRRHHAGQALREFAEQCAFIEHESTLLDRAIQLLKKHTLAPGVALFERTQTGYAVIRQLPHKHYPQAMDVDDPVAVALRAGLNEVNLLDTGSTPGSDGYAFPMMVRGYLLGFVVVAHRPSEHYSKEERTLLAYVVHEIGIALFAARARDQAAFLHESVNDNALPESWRDRARKLVLGSR